MTIDLRELPASAAWRHRVRDDHGDVLRSEPPEISAPQAGHIYAAATIAAPATAVVVSAVPTALYAADP